MSSTPVEKTNVGQFLGHLHSTGILPAAEFDPLATQWNAKRTEDAGGLARELVQQGKLTRYQAASLYQGKPSGVGIAEYLFLDRLGTGGSGSVYKAKHRETGAAVAVKVLNLSGSRSADALTRFQREAETAARLNHPNIVRALETGEAGGRHYCVMELIEGVDLSTYVKKQGPLKLEQAVECIVQAGRALAYAHEQGIIHRDIKPANLMLCRDGKVKVLDMGLARLQDPTATGSQQAAEGLTQTGQVMGTVDYMAPEQALHTRLADARADVYSLGVTFYRLVTGEIPFNGDSLVAKILAHREQPIPSLAGPGRPVPPAVDYVFRRMLAKRPEDRYQTMHELVDDLLRGMSGQNVMPLQPPVLPAIALPAAYGDPRSLTTGFLTEPRSHSHSLPSVRVPEVSQTPTWKYSVAAFLVVVAAAGALMWKLNRDAALAENAESVQIEKAIAESAPARVAVRDDAEASNSEVAEATPLPAASTSTETAAPAAPPSVNTALDAMPTIGTAPAADVAATPGAEVPSPLPLDGSTATVATNSSAIVSTTGAHASMPSNAASTETAPPAISEAPTLSTPADPPKRLKVPDDQAVAEAGNVIRDVVFKAEYSAAKKLADRSLLGEKIYAKAPTPTDDPVGCYAVYREARILAAETGNIALITAVSRQAAQTYEVDARSWMAEAFEAVLTKNLPRDVWQKMFTVLRDEIDGAIDDEEFDTAERLFALLGLAGRKTQNTTVNKLLTERTQAFTKEKALFSALKKARETLAADADDPAAHTTLGKYLCFTRNDWDLGLQHLAKGNDPIFRELAEKSLPTPTAGDDLVAVADLWWTKGEKPSSTSKELAYGALHWYTLAAVESSGLTKSKVEKRIEEARKIVGDSFGPRMPKVADVAVQTAMPSFSTALPSGMTAGTQTPPQPAFNDPGMRQFISWVYAHKGYLFVRHPQGSKYVYAEAELASLPSFTVLSVRFREARGAVLNDVDLDNLATVSWLSQLLFDRMPISDAHLAELAKLPVLQELTLINCSQVTDAGVAALEKSTSLSRLTLSRSSITDQSLAVLGRMRMLTALYLSDCRISDAGLAHCRNMPQLGILHLDGTNVSDAGLVHLAGMQQLDFLSLARTQVTGAGLGALASCRDLDSLILSGTKLNDAGLAYVAKLPTLRMLYVQDTAITDSAIAMLTALPSLSTLDLSGCRISDNAAPALAKMSQLSSLRVGRTGLSQDAVQAIKAQIPRCNINTK